MEPSKTSEIQKNRRCYNHNGWESKYSIGTKSKHNMKINIQIFIKNIRKIMYLSFFYNFILKALSNFSFHPSERGIKNKLSKGQENYFQ